MILVNAINAINGWVKSLEHAKETQWWWHPGTGIFFMATVLAYMIALMAFGEFLRDSAISVSGVRIVETPFWQFLTWTWLPGSVPILLLAVWYGIVCPLLQRFCENYYGRDCHPWSPKPYNVQHMLFTIASYSSIYTVGSSVLYLFPSSVIIPIVTVVGTLIGIDVLTKIGGKVRSLNKKLSAHIKDKNAHGGTK